jgi:hypothetical protein
MTDRQSCVVRWVRLGAGAVVLGFTVWRVVGMAQLLVVKWKSGGNGMV